MAMASGSSDLVGSGAPPPGGGAQAAAAAAEEEEREVVRVRVKKCESCLPPEFRSFAVDPQITSLDVLQHILIRAFDLNGKKAAFFLLLSLSYPVTLPRGDQHFTSFQCALQIQAGVYLFLCLCNKVEINDLTSGCPQSLAQYPAHSGKLFSAPSVFPCFFWKLSLGPPGNWGTERCHASSVQ
uniref:TBC1 domain family member 25 n=1 Tax=Equus asinus TaxID=9793 RepID=A0A9L0ILP0_EQUAS